MVEWHVLPSKSMTAAFPSLTQQYLYSAQWSEMDDLILYMTIILPLTLMFAVVEWTSALAAFLKIKRDESHGFSVFFYPFAPPQMFHHKHTKFSFYFYCTSVVTFILNTLKVLYNHCTFKFP